MSEIKVITNNVPRDIIDVWELTESERAEFDYLDWPAIDEGRDSASFFRYRGELHDLGEFSSDYGITKGSGLPDWLNGWHGYRSDSFFSAMVVKYPMQDGSDTELDSERVIVGRVYS